MLRAALAIGALLLAAAPAGGVRISEWSIDPRADLDAGVLLGRLREVLETAGAAASAAVTAAPLRVRVRITAVENAEVNELLIRSTDLDGDRSVRSTVRPAPGRLATMELATVEVVVAALVADLGYLQAARAGFPAPPDAPPQLTDLVSGQTLAALMRTVLRATGDRDGDAAAGATPRPEILDVAAHARGVSVLLAGGAVDLGSRFELTAATAASLLPAAAPPAGLAAPHEVARTRWTYDTLTLEPARARIVRRRSGDGSVTALDLPAGGRRLDAVPRGGLTALTAHGPAYLRLTEREIELHPVPVAARFITAMDVDRHRRLVLYDAFDRRVVIVGLDGRERGSIRPQVDPRLLPFPHALAVLADGSILLGGAGTVWAFDSSGRPRWLLARPRGGREVLPPQFLLEPAPDREAFYLLDGPRMRIMRFGAEGLGAPTAAVSGTTPTRLATQLAAAALSEALAARAWGSLTEAAELAHLAAEVYEHAHTGAPDDQELRAGLDRAVDLRNEAESVIYQERFLQIGPERLVIAAAGPGAPVQITLQVENPGAVVRTGVRLLAAGVEVPLGSIDPGERVERLLTLGLPESLLATRESIALELGVVISADEPGRGRRRRMFVTLPLLVPAPRWEQAIDGASARPH